VERFARGQRRLNFLAIEIALQRRDVRLGDEILTRYLAGLNQLREWTARGGCNRRVLLGAVALRLSTVRGGKEIERRRRLARILCRRERRTAALPHYRVETPQRLVERLRLVRDLELQKGGALHEPLCARAVIDAGKLNDDELIDAVAHHLQCAVDRLRLVRDHALGVVHLQREIHPALQIESLLERHALDRRVVKEACLGASFANGDGPGPERPDGRNHENEDDEKTITNIVIHASERRN